ncbi:MAG: hypothetical protein R3C14_04615 [Caldilineaceae bacterium]
MLCSTPGTSRRRIPQRLGEEGDHFRRAYVQDGVAAGAVEAGEALPSAAFHCQPRVSNPAFR